MAELDMLRSQRPDVAPPTDEVRRRARAELAKAVQAEARPRRIFVRVAAASAVTLVVAVAMVVGLGSPSGVESPSRPWLLGPEPAGALTEVKRTSVGSSEIRFLHPTADPERIRAELEQHGFDIEVTFVASDPFTVGTLVMYEGDEGIETIRVGTDLTGGGYGHDVGIVVPDGWSGSAHLGIGREALPGERFESSVAVNAERPGGPLHCAGLRGMPAFEAAERVSALNFQVEWRTQTPTLTGQRNDPEPPPADYVVHDLLWTASDEIMLFAAAGEPPDRPAAVTELITRGCDGSGR